MAYLNRSNDRIHNNVLPLPDDTRNIRRKLLNENQIQNTCKRRGDVAYLTFDVNPDFDSVAAAIHIPAKNEWIGFFPKFSHEGLKEIPEVLNRINNKNHEQRPDRHPTSEEKLEQEQQEWQTVELD